MSVESTLINGALSSVHAAIGALQADALRRDGLLYYDYLNDAYWKLVSAQECLEDALEAVKND